MTLSVHPRLRGELNLQLRGLFDTHGSSPLTRGTLYIACILFAVCRFIPAYAGNSVEFCGFHSLVAVHPRLRGELSRRYPYEFIYNGSSPLTRGTPEKDKAILNKARFIPAYAGNSIPTLLCRGGRTVHPRLRGELFRNRKNFQPSIGSSPLTRGTHKIVQ